MESQPSKILALPIKMPPTAMPRKCCFYKCVNNSNCIKMFSIPVRDPAQKKAWLDASGNKKLSLLVDHQLRRRYVCAGHFSPDQFMDPNCRIRLMPNAVPTPYADAALTSSDSSASSDSECSDSEGSLGGVQEVHMCAACLATHVQMYRLSFSGLLEGYHLLTDIYIDDDEGMPQYVCWECAALVNKFKSFRYKCERAYKLLQDFPGLKTMKPRIREIIRERHGLSSGCGVRKSELFWSTSQSQDPVKTEDLPDGEERFYCEPQCEEDLVKDETEAAEQFDTAVENKKATKSRKRSMIPGGDKRTKRKKCNDYVVGTTQSILTQEEVMQVQAGKRDLEKYKKAKYKCDICFRVFTKMKYCTSHMLYHDASYGSYQCDVCNLRFKTKIAVERHIQLHHSKKYCCKLCHCVFYSKGRAAVHRLFHQGRLAKQQSVNARGGPPKARCNLNFTTVSLTQEQMMEELKSRGDSKYYKIHRYKCTHCFIGFWSLNTFTKHMLRHDEAHGQLQCDLCGIREKTCSKMSEHMTRHMTKYSCNRCPYVCYHRAGAKLHSKSYHGDVYPCDICGSAYKHRARLLAHARRQHPAGHACGACAATFPSAPALWAHAASAHEVETGGDMTAAGEAGGARCVACDFQFASRAAWTRHVLVSPKHAHERDALCPLGCRWCGETAADAGAMRRHRAAHRRAERRRRAEGSRRSRSEPCQICREPMANSSEYRAHFSLHHPGHTRMHRSAGGARYVCDVCGMTFKWELGLKRHVVEHTGDWPYTCDTCNKGFVLKHVLIKHIRTHTNARPYMCDVCGKRFTAPFNLIRHKLVHTDAWPYICSECGKAFKYKESYEMHLDHVHKNKPWPRRIRRRTRVAPPPGTHRSANGKLTILDRPTLAAKIKSLSVATS